MISVITGDIINSRAIKAEVWINSLKEVLGQVGDSPELWEIYRGDSFQVEIKDPKYALHQALQIKAAIKSHKNLDVHMSIGIGEKDYDAGKVTESNGSAFIYSGEGFDAFKGKQTLSFTTESPNFDNDMNLMLKLSLIVMDNWTPAVAEYASLSLRGGLVQNQIAKKLGITQSSVSERHKRSHLNEIREMDSLYKEKIRALKIDQ